MNEKAQIPSGYDDDDDALAAEYVLGVLDRVERARVATRIGRDAGFAHLVANWEARLSGLDNEFAEVPPPRSAKAAIDRRLFVEPSRGGFGALWASLAFWRGVSVAALAGLVLLAFIALHAPEGGTESNRLIAFLAPANSDKQFVALYEPDRGGLSVTRVGGGKPTGRDEELWLIEKGRQPASLGLIGATGGKALHVPPQLAANFIEGVTLAVSDEPPGGSPTGAPTGAVIALGPVKKF